MNGGEEKDWARLEEKSGCSGERGRFCLDEVCLEDISRTGVSAIEEICKRICHHGSLFGGQNGWPRVLN